MKRIILLLFCLVLASVVKALDTTDKEDPTDQTPIDGEEDEPDPDPFREDPTDQTPIDGEGDEPDPDSLQADDATKYEDELMEETMNQRTSKGTDGDETAMRAPTDKKETSSDENECHQALGMESGAISEAQISASSEFNADHAAIQGRLNFQETTRKSGSWSARTNDANQWLQIDRGNQLTKVTRLASQGRNYNPSWPYGAHSQWVTKYKVQYSNDGSNFQNYKEQGQSAEKEFAGNTDRDTVVSHDLNPPITARYIRFRPTAWHGHISMRVELYGCKGLPTHPEVNVTCGENEMWISIPKRLLPALDREHLRLSDVNCGATETRTHYILYTKLTECHTISRHTKNFVCYMNKVEEIPVEEHQIITRVREVEIPYSCYYSNMGVVSAVGLQVKSKKIVFSKKGYGRFVLEMKIFPSASFQYEYKKKDFPVMLPLRKILYVEVSVDTEDRRLEILAEECFATPDSDPNKPGLKYTFIKDGCAVDDTVNFIPTPDKRKQRFSLEAFAFIGDHQFVYMHCRVKICNASDPNSRCAQGCIPHRGKRSLMTLDQETKDEEYNLAQGPFMRLEDETQLDETVKEMHDVEKSAKFPTLVAAMAVVAAVCIMGVSYFAWDRRKQKALRDYQRLTVPSD